MDHYFLNFFTAIIKVLGNSSEVRWDRKTRISNRYNNVHVSYSSDIRRRDIYNIIWNMFPNIKWGNRRSSVVKRPRLLTYIIHVRDSQFSFSEKEHFFSLFHLSPSLLVDRLSYSLSILRLSAKQTEYRIATCYIFFLSFCLWYQSMSQTATTFLTILSAFIHVVHTLTYNKIRTDNDK